MKITMCAKSRWHPAVRREHALTFALLDAGHSVDFVEQPRDVRDLRRGRVQTSPPSLPHLRVLDPFTPVPGHHDRLAHAIETVTLTRIVRRTMRSPASDSVVVNAPWNWRAAVLGTPRGVRRVVDLGDDWATLMPHRRKHFEGLYRRIADEADAIVVVTPALQALFDRDVHVVPNAVAPQLLRTAPAPLPDRRRMVYVGTLSERFDSDLMLEVLTRLPDWTLDLYGPCHYAGLETQPSPALTRLLGGAGGRARWHGVVGRDDLTGVLDRADVLVLPNEATRSEGQDPMKLYDYAARGRPIVATRFRVPASLPPAFVQAADAQEFADAVAAAPGDVSGNRTWAEANSWSARLPGWLEAVRG